MTKLINSGPLAKSDHRNEAATQTMIRVSNVSMVFNMASEKLNNLKEYAIAIARNELRFKEFRALDSISLEVKKGDVFGIMGTNGSGKSTLLKIVAGVLEPTTGSCEINGRIAPLIELGAGFDLELTARENIYLNGALLGYSRKFIEKNFDEIVEFAEIGPFLDMPMKNYSSGMVARIAFAIATIIVPDILIVDEVLSVGDFMFQQKCERRIMELIDQHEVTVLIVSHNNDQIERLCNKAIWIEKGHTRMIGSAEEVCRVYRVLGGHLGSPESEQRVFDMLSSEIAAAGNISRTISSEDRYGSAVKLAEASLQAKAHKAVIALGDDASVCLAASSFASAINAPILLTRASSLPDITSLFLKTHLPEDIFVISSNQQIDQEVLAFIKHACPQAMVREISATSVCELSDALYQEAIGLWGDTAVVTWDGCTGDLITISPFTALKKAPIFFNSDHDQFTKSTLEALSAGAFRRIIVLGGFPDACFKTALEKGVELVRFCGKDAYDANTLINNWLQKELRDEEAFSSDNLIVTSFWYPQDAFTAGAFAARMKAMIMLEDPDNLDSIVNAFNFIDSQQGRIKNLIFLGDHSRFNPLDRLLLEKAVTKAMNS